MLNIRDLSKIKIVIDNHIPFIKGVFEAVADVVYLSASDITRDVVRTADALIIRTRTHCNADLLSASSVKFIATATIGFDHIDTDFCKKNGIVWTNAAGCNASSVAQYVASALAVFAEKNQCDLAQKTLGIVGVGHVGKAVARVAELLGMRLLLNDPIRRQNEKSDAFVSLDEIANSADIITFHTPLTFDGDFPTHHLANAEFFKKLKRKPLIINAARGGVVDESALKNALSQQLVSDCVVDCWENEPNLDTELLRLALIATPHIAGYSADCKANATTQSVRAVSRFFGLGFDDFVVQDLSPKQTCKIARAELPQKMLENYNILSDDAALRTDYTKFEQLRSNYPIRREVDWLLVYS